METRILMTASAVFLAVLGLGALFLPQEFLAWAGAAPPGLLPVVIQVAGALCLGFAMMNWMARGLLIGGIYARPLALGNFVHFGVAAVTFLKYADGETGAIVLLVGGAYTLLAIWFGRVLFRSPAAVSHKE